MCGIFGHFDPAGSDCQLVERMGGLLHHRGPDGIGVYQHASLAFGAVRLAIIDLEAPAGPLFNEDRSVAVAFNGEVYNFRALRHELEALGHIFATRTDTEVVVHGYEEWGIDVLGRLRGMFALAVWDEKCETLLLARDRLGQKPLYFTRHHGGFLFASEIKALFARQDLPRRVNTEALAPYLALGYVPPPGTMFAGIHKLAPGEVLTVNQRGMHSAKFWQPVMESGASPLAYPDAVAAVQASLKRAVTEQMVADVPVGTFLSGGVDSTAVTALAAQTVSHRLQTFTVGFDFPSGSEADRKFNTDLHHAAIAARMLDTDHHAIIIRQDESLSDIFVQFVRALEEPVAQHAITQTAYITALARHMGVPVLLTGDAADELFLGYTHYRSDQVLQRYLGILPAVRQHVLGPVFERLPARFDALRKLAHKAQRTEPALRYLEWMRIVELERIPALLREQGNGRRAEGQLQDLLTPLLNEPQTRHFADRIAFASLKLWIAEDSNMRVDKMSMMMSVESRSPFQDHELVELALGLPLEYKLRGGGFKQVLKDAVAGYVPAEALNRPKWGFSPPSSAWLRTALRPLVECYLSPEYVEAAGYFDPEAVNCLVQNHLTKRSYELWPVFALLIFHIWHALYIDQSLDPGDFITPAQLLAHSEIRRIS